MGTFGTAISSNDTYADIYGLFFELYNDGLEVTDISKKLIADNQEIINDSDDSHNFWFALAKAQWECRQLKPTVHDRVKKIILSGADIEIWRQLGADEKDLKKRKKVLDKFLVDIQTIRPKEISRKKKIIRQPIFSKGDCLTFKLSNGNYGGAVVLGEIRDTAYNYNLIATTRINLSTKPTNKDFERAEVLIKNYANWKDDPNIDWFLPIHFKTVSPLVEKVGTIGVELKYDTVGLPYGACADFDTSIIDCANRQFEFEKANSRPTKKLTIKELTMKKKFRL